MKSLGTIFFLLWTSVANGAEAYRFIDISVPNAAYTAAFGINDVGDVVGVFGETTFGKTQAFLYSDGQYYEVAVAGANTTVPFGINRHGVIAGTFVKAGQFAFLMDDIKTTVLDQAVRADAVNNRNDAVGYLSSGTWNQLAYVWVNGKYIQPVTVAEVPGILGSAATGINDRGDVVGYWFTDVDDVNVKVQGFVRKAGKLNPVDIIPLGINSDGVIVGLSGAGADGAILENGVVTLIKVPGSDYTQVHGINNKGVLVGYYTKAGIQYGFIGEQAVSRKNRSVVKP